MEKDKKQKLPFPYFVPHREDNCLTETETVMLVFQWSFLEIHLFLSSFTNAVLGQLKES